MITLPQRKVRPPDPRTRAERKAQSLHPKAHFRCYRIRGGVQWCLIQHPDVCLDTGWAHSVAQARRDAAAAKRLLPPLPPPPPPPPPTWRQTAEASRQRGLDTMLVRRRQRNEAGGAPVSNRPAEDGGAKASGA